jgi:hypothetical protein
MEFKSFSKITIEMPLEHIYSRLGYARGKTKISKTQEDELLRSVSQAEELLSLQGAGLRLGVKSKSDKAITLDDGVIFESLSLAQLFHGCDEALLIGATAGTKMHDFIKQNSREGDVTKAVIFDAVASECVDKALDWIMDYFYTQLRREGRSFSRFRFSAGYSDFTLDNQRVFYDKLRLMDFGVRLTSNSMFVPEKTVTAVVGIKNI